MIEFKEVIRCIKGTDILFPVKEEKYIIWDKTMRKEKLYIVYKIRRSIE